MKIEKIETDATINILGLTEREFVALKVLINMSRVDVDEWVLKHRSVWGKLMELKEAQDLAQKVGNIIWGLTVEGDYHSSTPRRMKNEVN